MITSIDSVKEVVFACRNRSAKTLVELKFLQRMHGERDVAACGKSNFQCQRVASSIAGHGPIDESELYERGPIKN